jgi:hypothetical protein
MSHDERWQQTVRATLRAEDAPTDSSHAIASTAIARGTERLAARAGTRVALAGMLLVGACALAAWRWSELESSRAAEAALKQEALWIP